MSNLTDVVHPDNSVPPVSSPARYTLSLVSMILGIVSVFLWLLLILQIAAIVLGVAGLRRDNGGRGFAATGIALGSVFLLVWSLFFGAVAYRIAIGPDVCGIPGDQFTVTMTDRVGDPLPSGRHVTGANLILDRVRGSGLELVGTSAPDNGVTVCVAPPGSDGIRELLTAELAAGFRPVVATVEPVPDSSLAVDPSLGIDEATRREFEELDCTAAENQGFKMLDPRNFAVACDEDGFLKYLLGPEEISDSNFTGAEMSPEVPGKARSFVIKFDARGTESMTGMTTELVASPDGLLALTIDGTVVMAVTARQPTDDGEFEVDGSVSEYEMERIVGELDLAIRGVVFEISDSR